MANQISKRNGYPNIKLHWNWASNDFIDTLNDSEHFLGSFLTTLGRFYITFATVTEYQNQYQSGYANIKQGWNCASNDFIYTSKDAEYFVMAFPTTLSIFYITFATITEYQNGYPNIKLVWTWASNDFIYTSKDAEHFLR